ncbi:DUF2256 domain-containing protein [Halomonas sp. G15]|uniref:DUF2256 domain-containing protein n=1 Tax=Halomonas sp. G15 TaxID=2903521 RepID=UPI002FCD821A
MLLAWRDRYRAAGGIGSINCTEPVLLSFHVHAWGSVMHCKPYLPHKTCTGCGRPFAWRRKWARCWEEVRHCSERCRREARRRSLAS